MFFGTRHRVVMAGIAALALFLSTSQARAQQNGQFDFQGEQEGQFGFDGQHGEQSGFQGQAGSQNAMDRMVQQRVGQVMQQQRETIRRQLLAYGMQARAMQLQVETMRRQQYAYAMQVRATQRGVSR
jgi:hypothetical protein